MPFKDHLPLKNRREAGRLLARELSFLRGQPDLLVLALPRGGVPVAFEIARALQAPMDVFLVRKIGMPGHPEFAAGAIATGDVQVMDVILDDPFECQRLQDVVCQETRELARREQAYRGNRAMPDLHARSVLLVDDGLATGATMEAAARAIRRYEPRLLVAAAPVGSAAAVQRLTPWVDRLVVGAVPEPFDAVSSWYQAFPQCTDAQVCQLLEQSHPRAPASYPT